MRPRQSRTNTHHADEAESVNLSEIMAELDELAAAAGITWGPAERGPGEQGHFDTSVRTRYAKPGQACGRGVVREVSPKQVAFIKRLLAERDTSKLVRLPGSEDIEHMSLRGARDLIERLLGCPELPISVRKEPKATEKQIAFITSLAKQKNVDLSSKKPLSEITPREASDLISELKSMPNAARAELEAGMYRTPDGVIFKVQRAVNGSGNLYAKRLHVSQVDGKPMSEFVYESGSVRKLNPEWRMTLEQAKEFGAIYGVCCVCSRTLTDEVSIEEGIGPICGGRL